MELGRGSFGVVYRTRVRKADAAVKVVRGGDEREQARLLHEVKVLEQCNSAHIVQFYGYRHLTNSKSLRSLLPPLKVSVVNACQKRYTFDR